MKIPALGQVATVAVIVFAIFGAGYELRAHQDHVAIHRADSTATVRLAGMVTAQHALDSTLAAQQAAYGAQRVRDDMLVHSSHDTAARSGATATHQLETAIDSIPACDSGGIMLRLLARADTAFRRHLAADTIASIADSTRHAHDVARIDSLQTWAIPRLQRQRDDAFAEARSSLARAIAAEKAWSPLRRVITGAGCVVGTAGLLKGNLTVGAVGAAVCTGSLALR